MHRSMTSRRQAANATNIIETESGYQLAILVPGYQRDEINIEVVDRQLTITADKSEKDASTKTNYREWQLNPVHKSWTLGKAVDVNQVDAKLQNGILTIDLAKKPEAKPKTIEIA